MLTWRTKGKLSACSLENTMTCFCISPHLSTVLYGSNQWLGQSVNGSLFTRTVLRLIAMKRCCSSVLSRHHPPKSLYTDFWGYEIPFSERASSWNDRPHVRPKISRSFIITSIAMTTRCLALCWVGEMHESQIFPLGMLRIWLVEQGINKRHF